MATHKNSLNCEWQKSENCKAIFSAQVKGRQKAKEMKKKSLSQRNFNLMFNSFVFIF